MVARSFLLKSKTKPLAFRPKSARGFTSVEKVKLFAMSFPFLVYVNIENVMIRQYLSGRVWLKPERYFFLKKIVNYHDYCRQIRALKETNGVNKSLKFLLLDFADMHGDNGKIYPSNETLAENNCISVKSIEGLLSRARTNNLIKTSPARKGQKRFITLLCPDDGQPIFLQIRKKNQNNFANTQKSTFYKNDKIKKNGSLLPLSLHWNGFLVYAQKNNPEKFDYYLEIKEDQWINCYDFKIYLDMNGVQLQ